MLVRLLVVPLTLLALMISGCSSGGSESHQGNAAKPIAGDWIGTLKQEGLAPFTVAVQIEASGSGRVAYTGIRCSGTWTLQPEILGSRPPIYGFDERIDEGVGGECKGSGDVSIQPELLSPKTILHYDFTGGGVKSHGLIHRTNAEALKPVFDQAGVEPPN